MEVGGQRYVAAALPPGKPAGTHCTRGWVGIGAGLNRYGKPHLRRRPNPDRPANTDRYFMETFYAPCRLNMIGSEVCP